MDESIDSMDEKNPDIIPQNSGKFRAFVLWYGIQIIIISTAWMISYLPAWNEPFFSNRS
jgi:hypothetical protein